MSQPLQSAVLDQARAVMDSYNPSLPWVFQDSQDFGSSGLSGAAQVETVGAQHWSISRLAPRPTMPISLEQASTEIVAQAQSQGRPGVQVAYIEAWSQDGRVAGTGYVTWFYVAVYTTG